MSLLSSLASLSAGLSSPSVATRSRCRTNRSSLSVTVRSTMLTLFGLLVLGTISSVHAMTLSDEPGEHREAVATNIPEFISKGDNSIILRENSSIALDCNIKDLGEYVLMWRFTTGSKSVLLYADNIAIEQKKSEFADVISLHKATNGIFIKRLTTNLTGEYRCEVSTNPPKLISYTISMMTAPVIVPSPPSGSINVRKGESFTLRCNIKPLPAPVTVQWLHNDKIVEDNSTVLQINNVQSSNEGAYTCVASNDIGQGRFTFAIGVEYEPEITLSEKIIHGPIGDDVQVRCEVKANPRADISWQFSNNSRVHNSNKHRIEISEKYSILRILNVDLKDYDNYYCQANNSIGSQSVFFEVTGRPSKPKFISPRVGNDGDSYLVEWTVFSQYPIRSYDLRWREVEYYSNRHGEWKHIPITPANEEQGSVRKQSYRLDNLSQVNGYQVELEVENEFGKTKSDSFSFTTTESNSASASTSFGLFTLCLISLMLRYLGN